MKNILRSRSKYQSFIDWIVFVFQLFFGLEPESESPKPFVFVSPGLKRFAAVELAARNFELKKQGVIST